MTRRPGPAAGARRERCPRCGARVLRQLVGPRAALDVTADDQPLTPAHAAAQTTDHRLTWCLTEGRWTGPNLRWVFPAFHPADCPRPHLLDHQCTTTRTAPDTLF